MQTLNRPEGHAEGLNAPVMENGYNKPLVTSSYGVITNHRSCTWHDDLAKAIQWCSTDKCWKVVMTDPHTDEPYGERCLPNGTMCWNQFLDVSESWNSESDKIRLDPNGRTTTLKEESKV